MKLIKKILNFLKPRLWYILLLISSTVYVLTSQSDIFEFEKFNSKNLIFILWLVLLLLPLFSEMEFFGIKLKKEIEQTKAEVKDDLNKLNLQIMELKLLNTNTNVQYVVNENLASKEVLSELLKGLPASKTDTKVEQILEPKIDRVQEEVSESIRLDVPDESVYLFKIRYVLEKLITDLCQKKGYKGTQSLVDMTDFLNRCELIGGNTRNLIIEIIKIINRGVHGEIISQEYINFVNQVFPELQNQLLEANNHLYYFTCRRCGYNGYSRFQNVCPSCDYVDCNE